MDTKYAARVCAANPEFAAPVRPTAHPVLRRLVVLAGIGIGFWLLTCLLHAAPASASTARPVHPLVAATTHRAAQPVAVVADVVHRTQDAVAAPRSVVRHVHARLVVVTQHATSRVRSLVSDGAQLTHRVVAAAPAPVHRTLGAPATRKPAAAPRTHARSVQHAPATARVTPAQPASSVHVRHTTATAPRAMAAPTSVAHTAASPSAGTRHTPLPRAPHTPGQPVGPVSGQTTPEHSGAALVAAARPAVHDTRTHLHAGPRPPAGVAGDEPSFSPD